MTRSTQPGLRFRTRKLAPKNLLPVLREDQIDSDEYKELLDNQYKVETGVEKAEENEYHLQEALAAALGRGSAEEARKIVPAPPAEETKDINYDELYKLKFTKSSSYIRFSQTVEECTGCQYDMSSEDDVFLKAFNAKRPANQQCSEDDFEKIMEVFETTAARQTPFAAVDNTVVAFELMEIILKQEIDKAQPFAKDIYEYWKTRRQASGNRPLQPTLKFELHQDSDDGDPYVCFRRRDVRQTRKTRARDFQVTDKLKKLRLELEEGRRLVQTALQREEVKRELLATDRKVFEMRAKLKDVRQQLGIKVDDEDLINQKPQKKRPVEVPQLRAGSGNQVRMPSRSDGRPLDSELTLLEDIKAAREAELQREIETKIMQHQKWNHNHVDMTMEPILETKAEPLESSFRLAKTHYLLTPPASLSDEFSQDQELNTADLMKSFAQPDDDSQHGQVAFRRRFGRNGRVWIDRRGLPSPDIEDSRKSDQWKYDQDSDDESPEYFMDPYNTDSLRFRASLPGAGPRRSIQQQPIAAGVPRVGPAVAGAAAGPSPNNPNIRLNSNSNVSIPVQQRQA